MIEKEEIRPGKGDYQKNATRDDSAVAGEEARDRWLARHSAS